MADCLYGDPTCPCQDGDICHYVDAGETKAMLVPPEYVRNALLAVLANAGSVPPDLITHLHGMLKKAAQSHLETLEVYGEVVTARDKALADVERLREALSDTLGRYAAEQIGWNSRTTPDWFVEYAGLAEGFGALKETKP